MDGYLGEDTLDISKTEYCMYTKEDWALFWIEKNALYDGEHHKQWLIDQLAQIYNGTKVIIKIAKWDNGHTDLRFSLDKSSEEYNKWVEQFNEWDIGIAP